MSTTVFTPTTFAAAAPATDTPHPSFPAPAVVSPGPAVPRFDRVRRVAAAVIAAHSSRVPF